MNTQFVNKNPRFAENDEETDGWPLVCDLIDAYSNLQRIKTAEDREKEIYLQLHIVRTKLKLMGVSVDNLNLK